MTGAGGKLEGRALALKIPQLQRQRVTHPLTHTPSLKHTHAQKHTAPSPHLQRVALLSSGEDKSVGVEHATGQGSALVEHLAARAVREIIKGPAAKQNYGFKIKAKPNPPLPPPLSRCSSVVATGVNAHTHNTAAHVPERVLARAGSPKLHASILATAQHTDGGLGNAGHVTVVRLLDAGSESASGGVERADGATFAADCEASSAESHAQLKQVTRQQQQCHMSAMSNVTTTQRVKHAPWATFPCQLQPPWLPARTRVTSCTHAPHNGEGNIRHKSECDAAGCSIQQKRTLMLAMASGAAKPSGTTFFLRCRGVTQERAHTHSHTHAPAAAAQRQSR